MIEKILVLIFAVGLFTAALPELEDLYRLGQRRIRSWWKRFHMEEGWLASRRERYEEALLEHIRKLLQMTFRMGTRRSVNAFLLLSAVAGLTVFAVSARWVSFFLGAAAAAAAGCLPYLILRCMVQGRRVASSHEGEILVTELVNNYKIYYCNMQQAIEVTALTLEDAPYSRQLLLNLSRGLQKASTASELKGILEEFRFAIGTSWAGILTTNMYLACYSGLRVTESLSDLARSMREARRLEEFSRREHNEARLILKYLVPAGSLLMVAGGIHFFGLTIKEYLHYQFQTGSGITWFLLWLVSYLASLAVHLLLSRRKFDL